MKFVAGKRYYMISNDSKTEKCSQFEYVGERQGKGVVFLMFVNVPGGWRTTFTESSIGDYRVSETPFQRRK